MYLGQINAFCLSVCLSDITFKEVDKFSRQAETRADQLGPRQSTVALVCATDLSETKV